MTNDIDTDFIVRHLVSIWAARLPNLAQYLHEQFGYSLTQPHEVKRLFIAQMADGDVTTDHIGGVFCMKWVVTEGVIEKVPLDYAYKEMVETDTSGNLFVSPSFLFCYDQDAILLSERYGPSLKRRLRGRVLRNRQPPTVEWDSLWSTAL